MCSVKSLEENQKNFYAEKVKKDVCVSLGLKILSLIMFIVAGILISLSFLPPTTIMFSGAFYVIGTFLVFSAAIIIIISLLFGAKTTFKLNCTFNKNLTSQNPTS